MGWSVAYVRNPADILNYGGINCYSVYWVMTRGGKYHLNKNNKFILSISRRLRWKPSPVAYYQPDVETCYLEIVPMETCNPVPASGAFVGHKAPPSCAVSPVLYGSVATFRNAHVSGVCLGSSLIGTCIVWWQPTLLEFSNCDVRWHT